MRLKHWVKIYGARAMYLLRGRLPARGTWPMVWGGSHLYRGDRWEKRDAGFERRGFDYQDAVNFLVASRRGGARDIEEGSIPETDLAFIADQLDRLGFNRPLRGLHIGNFVGLSLAYLTHAIRVRHKRSVMVSVDPNIPHRGIDVPQDLVTGLMTRYGLEANWLPISGYSLQRTAVFDVLNDPGASTAYASYHGFSAAQALPNLAKVAGKFEFVLIDGNHDPDYLQAEIAVIEKLLRPGGLLFLDDVDEDHWQGVAQVYEGLDKGRFRLLAYNGRVGMARRIRSGPNKARRKR